MTFTSSVRRWLSLLAVVLTSLIVVACGGGGGTPTLGTGSGTPSTGGTGSGSTAGASVTVNVSSATVTAASPVTVTVTVRDAAGAAISGTVVDLSTKRGSFATLSVPSVATAADGTATAQLSAMPGAVGADDVVAVAKLGTTTVQSSASFTVAGGRPTVALTISSTTLRGSTGAQTLIAKVKNAAGGDGQFLLVNFTSAGGKVKLGASTAMTDGFGVASVSVVVADPAVTAADTISASTTVSGLAVQSSLVVQLLADAPSMGATVSSSTVTAATPSTLTVTVKDATGVAVADGTIVSVKSVFGLSAFDVSTAATGTTATGIRGVALISISPKSISSNGADQIVASATVGGVPVSAQVVVQVSSSTSTSPPVLTITLSATAISSASPAVVVATLTDGKGVPVPGQVVTFSVVRGLAKTNIATALTDGAGRAQVVLSPINSTVAGADEVSATANFAGASLQSTKGFQVQATDVTLTSFVANPASLGAYGQTTLTLSLGGASIGSPVNISVTSACVSLGKATLSPATFTATTATVDLQYKDNGCGAVQVAGDKLQANVVGGAGSASLTLPITAPTATSLAFISASPEVIYIKGSGFTESSTLTFEVRDGTGNVLSNLPVLLELQTEAGGITMQGATRSATSLKLQLVQLSDANGRLTARVNSGTVPTPVRVSATLLESPLASPPVVASPVVATVSSNLSVAVGLPSQLNFSLSQDTLNIEGMNIDGTVNNYNIIASDRSGNPVPAGTSINFVTEGGQIEAIKQIALVSGLARATAAFVSASPRPADGRITVTAYALGEESFIDLNGNNTYDPGEPFQDLGNIFKDRIYDGVYDSTVDEVITTNIGRALPCRVVGDASGATAVTSALLAFDASIPSVGSALAGGPGSCDGIWSGNGTVYVRRAAETVLSTSTARALWANTSGLVSSCKKVTLQNGPSPASVGTYTAVRSGETWFANAASTTLFFTAGDGNTFPAVSGAGAEGRLNPMAKGTTITASTPTSGLTVSSFVGGSPIPSTTEATTASIGISFTATTTGVVFVTFTSPSGTGTTYTINVDSGARPTACP